MRSTGEPAEMPDAVSIIGGAPDGEPQPMHYFDSRGVKRLFMTTVDGATWRIWRAPGEDWNGPDGPGFNQRFIGEFSADGTHEFEARWERGLGEAGDRWNSTSRSGTSAGSGAAASEVGPRESGWIYAADDLQEGHGTDEAHDGDRHGDDHQPGPPPMLCPTRPRSPRSPRQGANR